MVGLLALPDEILKRIVSQLHHPDQLFKLALTCKHLQVIVEGATQTLIDMGATQEEMNNLPQVELPVVGTGEWAGRSRKWGIITKLKLILTFRDSLRFDQFVGDVKHAGREKSKLVFTRPVMSSQIMADGFGSSNRIMRSGVHKAKFELGPCLVMIGIARPMDYCNKSLYDNFRNVDPLDHAITSKYPHAWRDENKINVIMWSCLGPVYIRKGQRKNENRDSMTGLVSTDEVGFILDMDRGTLALYKNENRVGEVISGLSGEYVWVARLWGNGDGLASLSIREWD